MCDQPFRPTLAHLGEQNSTFKGHHKLKFQFLKDPNF